MHTQTTESLVGKILLHIGGYSMTLVDYYQIVAETPKTVTVRKLSAVDTPTGFLSGDSSPLPGIFSTDQTFRLVKRPNDRGEICFKGSMDHKGYMSFMYMWDGRPRSYNHCD